MTLTSFFVGGALRVKGVGKAPKSSVYKYTYIHVICSWYTLIMYKELPYRGGRRDVDAAEDKLLLGKVLLVACLKGGQ